VEAIRKEGEKVGRWEKIEDETVRRLEAKRSKVKSER
jgi:hypothetical protein